MHLTHQQARQVMIAAQGLRCCPDNEAARDDVLAAIRRMGVLQIDTIHVVNRSPYLVLWSRLGHYDPDWLDELLAEGALFEYWSHAASFLPFEDYPLYRRIMIDRSKLTSGWWKNHAVKWWEENRDEAEHMLAHIRANGPVRSSDFTRKKDDPGGWWNWKAEKVTLERLFALGELMIARRENFQRVYDLRERVLPEWDDSGLPSIEAVHRALVLKAVRAMGITTDRWVADYFRTDKRYTRSLPAELADAGELLRAEVEGWDAAYVHPENAHLVEQATSGQLDSERTTLLSPFDPLVWDRERAQAVFDFDYRLEAYTPAAKRQYGYFTLPILHRDRLVGRLDPKAHRKEGRLEIKALHLEPGVSVTDDLVDGIAAALRDFADWHGTPDVKIVQSDPPQVAARVQRAAERN